jgi:hypothetical protein
LRFDREDARFDESETGSMSVETGSLQSRSSLVYASAADEPISINDPE